MIEELIANLINSYDDTLSLTVKDYEAYWDENMTKLHNHHKEKNITYKTIVKHLFPKLNKIKVNNVSLSDLPFVPVALFKEYDLISINNDKVFKTLLSSGTTGKQSKIFLSTLNAKAQVASLDKIFRDFTGLQRPIMYAFDSKSSLRSTSSMNAKKAALLGFGQLCKKISFLLDSSEQLNPDFKDFSVEGRKALFFGFTSTIWNTLDQFELDSYNKKILQENAVMLHGGGWKKMQALNITDNMLKQKIKEKLGIEKVINYYGMVEQTGSVFMECSEGRFHINPMSNIICRNISNLEIINTNELGLAQVISLLPTSYPGHSILTDDIISIYSDKCNCGRESKSFKVHGRKPKVETRGCSDV